MFHKNNLTWRIRKQEHSTVTHVNKHDLCGQLNWIELVKVSHLDGTTKGGRAGRRRSGHCVATEAAEAEAAAPEHLNRDRLATLATTQIPWLPQYYIEPTEHETAKRTSIDAHLYKLLNIIYVSRFTRLC